MGGRPAGTYNKVAAAAAANLYQKDVPISEIIETLRISRAAFYEYLKREGVNYGGFKKSTKMR